MGSGLDLACTVQCKFGATSVLVLPVALSCQLWRAHDMHKGKRPEPPQKVSLPELDDEGSIYSHREPHFLAVAWTDTTAPHLE